jgi:SAM-dependent methyltransferase
MSDVPWSAGSWRSEVPSASPNACPRLVDRVVGARPDPGRSAPSDAIHLRFADHFASVSASYQGFRPGYPGALFTWLAAITPGNRLAWDCATGNGQAAVDLAGHFLQVVATDASLAQLAGAIPRPNIEYRRAAAEASGLPDRSVDLVTVAQALHWIDLPSFYAEVRRVLRPDGVLAAWSYGLLEVNDEAVNACIRHDYHAIIAPYWPEERQHVEEGYRSLAFPFAEIRSPVDRMTASWTLPEVLGYLRSWSATARYRAIHGIDPVKRFTARLAPIWGDPHMQREIVWPLSFRVGKARPLA